MTTSKTKTKRTKSDKTREAMTVGIAAVQDNAGLTKKQPKTVTQQLAEAQAAIRSAAARAEQLEEVMRAAGIEPPPSNDDTDAMATLAQLRAYGKQVVRGMPIPEAHADRREELRRLVREHAAITKAAVSAELRSSPRKVRAPITVGAKTYNPGDVIPTAMPPIAAASTKAYVELLNAHAAGLENDMAKLLKGIPIWDLFLDKVFGVGPKTGAYLVAMVDIHRCTKPSQLKRFCGMAVIDGQLERRAAGGMPKAQGGPGTYCSALRTKMFQIMDAMSKNCPAGETTKYLELWRNTIVTTAQSDRVVDGKIVAIGRPNAKPVSVKGFARAKGWHKAADVLLDDLYTVWRALEGLDIWPDWYARQRGFVHGGKVCVDRPDRMTVEEALKMVGNVGRYPSGRTDKAVPGWDELVGDLGRAALQEQIDDLAADDARAARQIAAE